MIFREDASRKRKGNSTQNLSRLNKIALNLLKNESRLGQSLPYKSAKFNESLMRLPCWISVVFIVYLDIPLTVRAVTLSDLWRKNASESSRRL